MPSPASNSLPKLLSEGWVSLNRLTSLLGVSYPTIRKLVKEGRLRAIKVGGISRVYASEVERVLREGTSEIVCTPEDAEMETLIKGETNE